MVDSPAIQALLKAIRLKEAGARGYDAMYSVAEARLGEHKLTDMNMGEIIALQKRMVTVSASSAVGGYQFIRKTLNGLVIELDLHPHHRFTPTLQDRMAIRLLKRRGLGGYLAGNLSREDFANNLAKEWASFPVVTPITGASRHLKPGQSYYAGDGLNKAFHDPQTILELLDELKRPGAAVPNLTDDPGEPAPEPPSKSVRPSWGVLDIVFIMGFIALVAVAIYLVGDF